MLLKRNLAEQRRYVRINTILPVEFRVISSDQEVLSLWISGFSNNVSRGGICVFSNSIPWSVWKNLQERETLLQLKIQIPFSWKTILTQARLIWKSCGSFKEAKFFLGLEFVGLSEEDRRNLIFFVYWRNLLPKISLSAIFILTFSFLYLYYQNQKIIGYNQRVAKELVQASLELGLKKEIIVQNQNMMNMLKANLKNLKEEFTATKKELDYWQKQYERLREEKLKLMKEALFSEDKLKEEQEAQEKISQLQEKLSLLIEKNKVLQARLEELKNLSASSQREVLRAEERRSILEQVAVEDMYKWIRNHQNLKTGLIPSFEGDFELSDWAFTYDQSLCINVFLLFSDFERARKILDFYNSKARTSQGGFLNAYYAGDGSACEYIVHCGPNIWLGLSILRYTEASGDRSYLGLAERIASFILAMQDEEGGVRGGVGVSWYATEHNLDAYAFLGGLYRLTHQEKYLQAQEKVKAWLKKYSYSRSQSPPINRGKGDATIATDTYAWSIASLGPRKLLEMEMDPGEIIKFAVENCRVKTYFQAEGEKIMVEGFDFARLTHLPRGGVISAEWTAQMVLAFQIMAKYYQEEQDLKQADFYQNLARHYLGELAKMVISSPSPTGQGKGCLPYASEECVDTGHGWRTPRGKKACSLASTSYYIFAYYGYNPLDPELGFRVFSSSK